MPQKKHPVTISADLFNNNPRNKNQRLKPYLENSVSQIKKSNT
ncbi:protein of unknown function [Moritella yayanosii]|uniref:Uncharacterized protein n=1 Tax=Moritella yayanosii TaxID=69539 RepID=A0A330LN79_9GAMM|nr:protein of unknown function [Moritella yayanosii]